MAGGERLCAAPTQPPPPPPASSLRLSHAGRLLRAKLWEEFFSDPSQWWDNRTNKQNPRFPDFKHKTANKALWIDNEFNPPWIHERMPAMKQCHEKDKFNFSEVSGKVSRTEQLWHDFFSDPMQWWDTRLIKKNPRYPDFKHKSTHAGLWIDGGLTPPWVKAKLATAALGEIRSAGGSSFSDGVKKLCQKGKLDEAIQSVERLIQQNMQAPINLYFFLLKECVRGKALAEGRKVHALIVQSGLQLNAFLGKALIRMYANCGSLMNAHEIFVAITEHTVISWTAIISAYADHGEAEAAIDLFWRMKQTGIKPDKVAYVVTLKACAKIAALQQGKQVHLDIIRSEYESDVTIANTLVDMYSKCGCIELACQAFKQIVHRDVVSWSAMFAGYVRNGLGAEAFALYEQMKREGVQPDSVSYVIFLKACISFKALKEGMQLHSDIIKSGHESDMVIGNTLVDMYAKCGRIERARRVFDRMLDRDVVSWSAMIAGYERIGLGEESLALYEEMKQAGMQPNIVTYIILLKACASITALEQGKQLHHNIITCGFESDVILGNTLVDMYAKCGCAHRARHVFDNMSRRDVVAYSSLIAAYSQDGLSREALALFEQMKSEGVQPNNVTYCLLLKACTCQELCKQLHSEIIKCGFESDVNVGNTLVAVYAKCGCIELARDVFNKMSEPDVVSCNAMVAGYAKFGRVAEAQKIFFEVMNERDVISWSTMIAGYAQNGLEMEALALYDQMKQAGVNPNNVTYIILLKACASISALEQGKQLHTHIIEKGFESDGDVGIGLIDMYAKCGCIEHAREVFDQMGSRDVVSWTSMIAGYAHQGLDKEAFILFERMQKEGTRPNEVTYLSLLSACSHAGLVDEGRNLFDSMSKDHGISPTMEHYACMVDLLGRAGCLVDAEDFINKIPIRKACL